MSYIIMALCKASLYINDSEKGLMKEGGWVKGYVDEICKPTAAN